MTPLPALALAIATAATAPAAATTTLTMTALHVLLLVLIRVRVLAQGRTCLHVLWHAASALAPGRVRASPVHVRPGVRSGKPLHRLPSYVLSSHAYRHIVIAPAVVAVEAMEGVEEVVEFGEFGQIGYVAPVARVEARAAVDARLAHYRMGVEDKMYSSAEGHYFVAFYQWCRVCRVTTHRTANCPTTQPRQQAAPPPPPAMPMPPPGLWPPLMAGQVRPRPAEWGDARDAP